ncbi:MAG: YajQ family cyclic di-GMP-binding protein [Myxococcota bacterium]|nr:YajQ family cyclic di-GMP-binding protein [Myxococcota bacterium]
MPSFDIVSKVQWNEVDNAFQQAQKEIAQRFDFKDTETSIEKAPDAVTIRSGSEDRAKAALNVFQDKLVKRKVSLRFTEAGKPEPTAKGGSRIIVKIKEGVEVEVARAIVQSIKDAKLKVQASIQEAQVRVTGKSKDDLQAAMAVVRQVDRGVEIQFANFRD